MGVPPARLTQPVNSPVLLYKLWYIGKLPSMPMETVCEINEASPSCPISVATPVGVMMSWQPKLAGI